MSQERTRGKSALDRVRKPKFSDQELAVLVEEAQIHHEELQQRKTSDQRRAQIWRNISQRVSAVGRVPRDGEDCCKRLNDLRVRVRGILSQHRSASRATGGGPPPPELTPWEEKMTALIDVGTIEGIGGAEAGTGIDPMAGTRRSQRDEDDGEEATPTQGPQHRASTSTSTPRRGRTEGRQPRTTSTSPQHSPARQQRQPHGRREATARSPQASIHSPNAEGERSASEPDVGATPPRGHHAVGQHSPGSSEDGGMITPQGSPTPGTQHAGSRHVPVRRVRTPQPDVDTLAYGSPEDRHSEPGSPVQAGAMSPCSPPPQQHTGRRPPRDAPVEPFVTGAAVMGRLDIIEAKQARVESMAKVQSRHIKAAMRPSQMKRPTSGKEGA
ncbi:myb-related transcription factor, partner of profilin-like [Ambystoma mexicanum]|uniref:myb-related transcription factor, partner of profilin-like n=1 Tax=Ambystoma mexicanum TaxID=8296 RepID=UPI0037E9C541